MPIVDVELVVEGTSVPAGMASRLAEALAGVFSSPPCRDWARTSRSHVVQPGFPMISHLQHGGAWRADRHRRPGYATR
jgi:hypothetical protein